MFKFYFQNIKYFSLYYLLIGFLVVLTLFTRLYKIGAIPSILNPDEASIAYNAYLLNETGKDEWGKEAPIILEAFGDQKPFVYPYLTVFSFKLFGYHDWSVRLPAAIAGIFIVWQAFRLGKVFALSKHQSLLFATLISLLPIFIFYSRTAYEAMIGLVLTLEIILLTYQKRTNQLLSDLLAVFLSFIAYFTYNAPFLIIPLLIPPIIIQQGLINWKKWLSITFSMFLVWLCSYLILSSFTAQKSQITIFSEDYYLSEYIDYRLQFSGITQTIVGNKYVFYGKEILSNYIQSFSPGYLLHNNGGHPWHTVPTTGYLYRTVFVFGMFGFACLIGITFQEVFRFVQDLIKKQKQKIGLDRSKDLLLLYVLIVSLFPASITVNAPHATRTLLFFIIFPLLSVKGLAIFISLINKFIKNSQYLLTIIQVLFLGFVLIESIFYFYTYFFLYANSKQMQAVFKPGYDEILHSAKVTHSNENIAVIDGSGFQYILTAWYLKMPPNEFFSTIVKQQPDTINFKYGEQVGNFRFIKSASDRFPDEQLLIEWNGKAWQPEEY